MRGAGRRHLDACLRLRTHRPQHIEEMLDALPWIFPFLCGHIEQPTMRAHRVLVDEPVGLQKSGFGLVDTISICTA
jgi:hypothetical protein